jgi:glycerol-3-phosphate dehydrogenase
MFVYPWEGATVIGITDMEHDGSLSEDAVMSQAELDLILQGANRVFPEAALTTDDIICSYSGVRPLVDDGTDDSTEAPRHHEVWQENGLITVTGGKLTTFRLTAVDALNKARKQLLDAGLAVPKFRSDQPIVAAVDFQQPRHEGLKNRVWQRLCGRYGNVARDVLAVAKNGELELIEGTHTCLVELRWATRAEMVETLADILLRRTRVGMLLPEGARVLWPQLEKICAEELSWDKSRWRDELAAYQQHYQKYYGLPAE